MPSYAKSVGCIAYTCVRAKISAITSLFANMRERAAVETQRGSRKEAEMRCTLIKVLHRLILTCIHVQQINFKLKGP